jgi:hypothetical protein
LNGRIRIRIRVNGRIRIRIIVKSRDPQHWHLILLYHKCHTAKVTKKNYVHYPDTNKRVSTQMQQKAKVSSNSKKLKGSSL